MAGNPRHDIRALVRHLLSFTGWRAGFGVAVMVLAAISEGVGLVLLVPIMAIVGIGPEPADATGITAVVAAVFERSGLPMNLTLLLAVFILLVSVRQAVLYVSIRYVEDTRIRYVGAIRKELFEAVSRVRWSVLKSNRLHEFSQLLLMDCWRIGDAAQTLFRIVSASVLVAANFAVALLLSPVLAVSVLTGVVVLVLVFGNRYAIVQQQGRRISDVQAEILKVVENHLDNLRVARMAGAESRMQARFGSSVDELGAAYSGFIREAATTQVALQLAGAVSLGAFLLIAVNVFGAAGPELLLLILIAARLIPQVSSLNQFVHRLLHCLPAFGHARQALRLCRDQPDSPRTGGVAPALREKLELEGVTVLAPDDDGRRIVDDVSFAIRAGEWVAITGPSGAGKSTLADVLSGLLVADSGNLRVDGKQLTADDLGGWRRIVGYVPQSAGLLRGTLNLNLMWLLDDKPDDDEIRAVLECTGLTDIVTALPDGLETQVEGREGTLSGGERQRITLARELLRKPELLLLDEASNAIDADSELAIMTNLRRCYPRMTVIMIAHGEAGSRIADRTMHMDRGRLSQKLALPAGPERRQPKEGRLSNA